METVKFSKLEAQLILRLLYSEIKKSNDDVERHLISTIIAQLEASIS